MSGEIQKLTTEESQLGGGDIHSRVVKALGSLSLDEPKCFITTVEEMLGDYQISFVMQIFRGHMQSSDVSISSKKTTVRAKKVTSRLQQLWNDSLPEFFEAYSHGRVAFEKVWEYSEEDARHHFIRKLEPLPYRETERIQFEGRFAGIMLTAGDDTIPIPVSKALWIAFGATARNPYGKSQFMGPLYWEWKRRRELLHLRSIAYNRFVLGGAVFIGPPTVQDEEGKPIAFADAISTAYSEMQMGSAMVIPARRDQNGNWDVEVIQRDSIEDPAPIEQALRESDVRVFRAAGFPELAAMQISERGSHALGKTHRIILVALALFYLKQLADQFKKYVVNPTAEVNGFKKSDFALNLPRVPQVTDQDIYELAKSLIESDAISPMAQVADYAAIFQAAGIPLRPDFEAKMAEAIEKLSAEKETTQTTNNEDSENDTEQA